MLYTVSQHPQVEAKIVEELKSLDLLATPEKAQPRPIQWDDVPKLPYLTAVIKVRSFVDACLERILYTSEMAGTDVVNISLSEHNQERLQRIARIVNGALRRP